MKRIVSILESLKQTEYIEYLSLCRPKILLLILFCLSVGILISLDSPIDWAQLYLKIIPAVMGIALAMAAGVVYHQLITEPEWPTPKNEKKIRPSVNKPSCLPRQQICGFCILLSLAAALLLAWVSTLILLLVWLVFFSQVIVYPARQKHRHSSQTLFKAFIFSLAPILGWAVVSSDWKPQIFSLALVIFFWVQVYTWADKIQAIRDYSHNKTIIYRLFYLRKKIFWGTAMIYIFAMLPFLFHLSGEIYILGAFILGIGFLQKSFALLMARVEEDILKLSELLRHYAIYYLPSLLLLMVLDHYLFFRYQTINLW